MLVRAPKIRQEHSLVSMTRPGYNSFSLSLSLRDLSISGFVEPKVNKGDTLGSDEGGVRLGVDSEEFLSGTGMRFLRGDWGD